MKKRSLILSVLLTIAMVFTMMPAMAFGASGQVSEDTNRYFIDTGDAGLVANANYMITAQDEDASVYAINSTVLSSATAKVRKTDVLGATKVSLYRDGGVEYTLFDGANDVIWRSRQNGNSIYFRNSTATSSAGDLYFASTGMKFQAFDNRPVTYGGFDKTLYVHAANSSSSHYYFMDFGNVTIGEENKLGFYTNWTAEADEPTKPEGTKDITLYREAYKVVFDLNGHGTSGTPDDQFADNDGYVSIPDGPTDSSWNFTGWFTSPACEPGDEFFGVVSENTTVYAGWEHNDASVDEAKKEAINQMNSTDLSKYKAEQQAAIKNAVAEATSKVNAADSMEGVNAALKDFNAFVAAQPTASDINYLAKVSLKNKKVKAGKKKFQIKWKAKSSKFDGYEVWYKAKGKGKSWKCVQVANAKAAKKTIKGLKAGKKYKAKVRGYKLYGLNKEVKVLGKFSSSKTVKVK